MMVCMDRLHYSLIGNSMKNTIIRKSLVLETTQFLNQMVLCFLSQFSLDIQIKNN